MAIDPINSMPSFRLVRPVESAGAVRPVAPAPPLQAVEANPGVPQGDSYSFESVYRAQLPIVDISEARARVERIRNDLVAGQVDIPIHFDASPVRSANPYAGGYLKLTPNPADLNAAATDLQDGE